MIDYIDNISTNFSDYSPPFDNYIYIYHTQSLIILPTFPEDLSDNMNTTYASTPILGRSAPIYSFSSSGPRTLDIKLKLHRDMMNHINIHNDSYIPLIDTFNVPDPRNQKEQLKRKDYVDFMIKQLQSIALPSYAHAEKMINPPLVAIRIGDEAFCKGIIEGGVSVNYSGPILANPLYLQDGSDYIYEEDRYGNKVKKVGKGKYAVADISFKVVEITPYDANTVAQQGSFRGLSRTLERNIYGGII